MKKQNWLLSSLGALVVITLSVLMFLASSEEVQAELLKQATTTAAATTTTASSSTSASDSGPNSGLPLYTPNKPITFSSAFLNSFDSSYRSSNGAAKNSKYDFLVTNDPASKIQDYYNNALKQQGYNQVNSTPLDEGGLKGVILGYTNGTDGKAVGILGPFTAAQATQFQAAVTSGTLAADDTLIILISGITATATPGATPGASSGTTGTTSGTLPSTGFGNINNAEGNNGLLWLVFPLALLAGCLSIILLRLYGKTKK